MSYYICIRCIYIRQYHVIVNPKVVPKKHSKKDAHWLNKSKTKEKKKFPRNINEQTSCSIFILLETSEFDFPAKSTSKIDPGLFFFSYPGAPLDWGL